jgi:drug/metabolite transporter (DMT)-like permease
VVDARRRAGDARRERPLAESASEVRWTGEAVLALGYLALAASALGYLIYFDLLERFGPIEINLVSYTAPVVAAVTGFLVLGEAPTASAAVGFALVLTGFVLVKRAALRAELARYRPIDRIGK